MLSIEYCLRAVVQYLNGDFKLFKKYRDRAMEIYENERGLCSIEEVIPNSTRKKLYKMVN